MAKEYICEGAIMMCDYGCAPVILLMEEKTVKIKKLNMANSWAHYQYWHHWGKPLFGLCNAIPSQPKPCDPEKIKWNNVCNDVKIKGFPALTMKSSGTCFAKFGGGKITFLHDGQTPFSNEAGEAIVAMKDQAQKELEDAGFGNSVGKSGFMEGMIPFWGSGRDFVHAVQTGDVLGGAIAAGFFALDCIPIAGWAAKAGIVAKMGASQAAKATISQAARKAAIQAAKKSTVQTEEQFIREFGKEIVKDGVVNLLKKRGEELLGLAPDKIIDYAKDEIEGALNDTSMVISASGATVLKQN